MVPSQVFFSADFAFEHTGFQPAFVPVAHLQHVYPMGYPQPSPMVYIAPNYYNHGMIFVQQNQFPGNHQIFIYNQAQNIDEPRPQVSQQFPEQHASSPLSIRRNARMDGFPAGPERQQDTEATQKLREWAERFRARRDQLKNERESEVVAVSETECTICFDKARNPTSCKACKQIIGCQRCIRNWIRTQADSNKAPSCPLCRGDGFANFELFD
ncbi:unnamed protein product [Bursaphelenchus xylophilus]|uniref:(pine wood nematode) hypothetical protein n=1 Tax=Bursaphelenchus xylophilus TaxID=6326 RepID=A0A1I7RUC1_BURXY|nr:unnamed protein product [Bursaphelenchus xylophilus]CAG9114017.1 unnamed protein product [Bursaphelenchus xylophilus]